LDLPAALTEPTVRVRPGWTSLLFFANIGLWLAIFAPIQVLLPEQAELLDASNKTFVFSMVLGVGALVSLVANPLSGLLSDRTCSRFGRRHPWTIGGALVGAAGLVVLADAGNVFVMTLGWCLVQGGLSGTLASLTAALPDRVPVEQRAQVGGLVGISQMLGTVLGAVLVTVVISSLSGGYLACAVVLVLGAIAFVVRTPDEPLPTAFRPVAKTRDLLANLWISPRAHPDFAWAWGCHFMIMLGNALGTLFLLFFLRDSVRLADSDTGLLIMMGFYGVALVVGALLTGHFSDRSGSRKPYVVGAAAVMAVAALILVFWQTWTAALIASPLLGVGFGAYMAVALAILTQVLPAAGDRAKDLGVVNIVNSLTQFAAPLMAAVILARAGGYPGLFAASAIATVAAGFLITRVKAVR
jgi:MFS family permease